MKSAFADDEDDPRYEQGEFVAEYLRDFQRVQTRARVSGACVCFWAILMAVLLSLKIFNVFQNLQSFRDHNLAAFICIKVFEGLNVFFGLLGAVLGVLAALPMLRPTLRLLACVGFWMCMILVCVVTITYFAVSVMIFMDMPSAVYVSLGARIGITIASSVGFFLFCLACCWSVAGFHIYTVQEERKMKEIPLIQPRGFTF